MFGYMPNENANDDIYDEVRALLDRPDIRGSITFHKGIKPNEIQVELNLKGRAEQISQLLKAARE
jgi:hypothetical protein